MKLTITVIALSLAAGILARGRISGLASLRVRWPFLAPIGLGLQLAPASGRVLPMVLLFVSFAILLVFGLGNLRLPGFALILLGLGLNLTVIAVNGGMAVTRHALVASGQSDTLSLLIHDGGAKHHLAGPADRMLPLADVIPVGVVHQAVSVGDLFTYAGVAWLIVASMRRRAVHASARPEVGRAPPSLEAAGVGG